LAERGAARGAIGLVKFRHLEPAQEGGGGNVGCFGRFLDVAMGEQRGDRLFLPCARF
jgi:hypothetical protein